MKAKTVAIVAVVALVAFAGCTSTTDIGKGIEVEDQQTSIEVSGDGASWTWSAYVYPPDGSTCDVTITVTMYNESGGEIASKTKVLKEVTGGKREVTYAGTRSQVNKIVTYEANATSTRCW